MCVFNDWFIFLYDSTRLSQKSTISLYSILEWGNISNAESARIQSIGQLEDVPHGQETLGVPFTSATIVYLLYSEALPTTVICRNQHRFIRFIITVGLIDVCHKRCHPTRGITLHIYKNSHYDSIRKDSKVLNWINNYSTNRAGTCVEGTA